MSDEKATPLKSRLLNVLENATRHLRTPSKREERGVDSKALFAEWRQDYALAKERDETGREPESKPPASKRPSWER